MSTITSANSVLAIAVSGIFSSPVQIQGYAVDDAFESEAVDQAEVQMGVDGYMSAGKVWVPYKMTIMLLANSPSIQNVFEPWRQLQDSNVDVFRADGSISLPSIGMVYTLNNGYLTQAVPFPAAKKVLQPVKYEITWQNIISNPIGAASF
jgi:hypothetical protein